MHDNSNGLLFDPDQQPVDRSHLPGHLSVLKFSDASDSDSSGEKEDQVNTGSYVYSMRDRREKPQKLDKKETWKDGKRYVNGCRKEVRHSVKNNVCIDLYCREGDYDLFFPLTRKWETHNGITVVGVSDPYPTELHNQHSCEGGAEQSAYWDSLPDYTELAGACRYRDGREKNPFGAPVELYPYLALTLSYCRAKLLRKNVCDFNLIPDDHVPVVNGPAKDDPDEFAFKEKTLNFFFGKRRETWPFIAYKEQVYDFSKAADLESESRAFVLARAEEESRGPEAGELGGMLQDILDMNTPLSHSSDDARTNPGVKLWKTKRMLPLVMHVSPVTEHQLFRSSTSRAAILSERKLQYASLLHYDVDHRPFATFEGEDVPRFCGNVNKVSGKHSCVRPNAGESILSGWQPDDAAEWSGSRRMWVIDSGSSVNTQNGEFCKGDINRFLRSTTFPVPLNSANGKLSINRVSRGKLSIWDIEADYMALPKAPLLQSMGERCLENDYSFLWIRRRYPCYILDLEGIIIVFDVDQLCPVWSPAMESSQKFFGSFMMYANAFREHCGIFIDEFGQIVLDLPHWRDREFIHRYFVPDRYDAHERSCGFKTDSSPAETECGT